VGTWQIQKCSAAVVLADQVKTFWQETGEVEDEKEADNEEKEEDGAQGRPMIIKYL
jgi:hypothetical protein